MLQSARGALTGKQYEKLADWSERVALIGFGSLVVQQLVQGVPASSPSVIIDGIITALAYLVAYHWLKQS